MPPASIAILPSNRYWSMEKTSFPANQWLCWIERTEREKNRNFEIKFYKSNSLGGSASKNDKEVREQKIGPCRVDGLMLKKERSDEQDWISDSKVVYRAIMYEFFWFLLSRLLQMLSKSQRFQ